MMAVKCLCFAKFVILRLARKQFVTWEESTNRQKNIGYNFFRSCSFISIQISVVKPV